MFRRILGGALPVFAVLFGLVPQPGAAQDLTPYLGPLAGVVTPGRDGPWEVGPANGWAMFTNRTDPRAVQTYLLDDPRLRGATYAVSANVALRPGGTEPAYAGIVVDRDDAGNYFAFVIGPDGEVSMFQNGADGLRQAIVSDDTRARMDGSDILEARIAPGGAEMIVNGSSVFEISDDNNVGFAPSVGIAVIGMGRFAFSDYRIDIAAGGGDETPFPPPGGGGTDDEPFPPPGGGGGTTPEPGSGWGSGDGRTTPEPGTGGREPTPEELFSNAVHIGVTLGIFFHELGHAVIGELNLPATGPEEDVADGFAAFVLAQAAREADTPEGQAFMAEVVTYSSLMWYFDGLAMERAGETVPWQDEHTPSLERFGNSFCIIYGSDPARYTGLADQVQFDERMRERCLDVFEKRYGAWEAILRPHLRDLGPDAPGDLPANAPGGRVPLGFGPTRSEAGRQVLQLLRDTGAMQEIVTSIERGIAWPRDLPVQFQECDVQNAWYDGDAGTITMCYSIIEQFAARVFEGLGGGGATAGGAGAGAGTGGGADAGGDQGGGGAGAGGDQGGGGAGTGGGGAGAGNMTDAVSFLVGVWQAASQTLGGQQEMTVDYAADGTYQLDIRKPAGTVHITGTWSAQMYGGTTLLVNLAPGSWTPRQLCDANGYCEQLFYGPQQGYAFVIDQNMIEVQGVNWRRIQ